MTTYAVIFIVIMTFLPHTFKVFKFYWEWTSYILLFNRNNIRVACQECNSKKISLRKLLHQVQMAILHTNYTIPEEKQKLINPF